MDYTASPIYLPFKLVHILSAIVFTGALFVALWWKIQADRSNDASYSARVHRTLRKMDAQIIAPSALLTFAAGYGMIRFTGDRIAAHFFALFGLIWFFLALGLWYFGMRNLGNKLAEDAESAMAAKQPLGREYAKRSAAWVLCAGGAIFFTALAAIFMVFRIPSG